MKSFRADYVFPVSADPIKNGVVTVDDYGKIISVNTTGEPGVSIQAFNGLICPGFINTHCHVELSHLKGKLPQHTRLVGFIKNVQQFRNADVAEVTEAALQADEEMYNNGIVAVGDISNTPLTIALKNNSKLYYHTFVEIFSFLPENAISAFDKALQLQEEFRPLPVSIAPHAPYSVSKELFRLIRDYCETHENLISMHNQECDEENKFFRYKQGEFNDLYKHFGIDISYFKPQARNSMQTVVPLLTHKQRILLVHNTCTNLKDIYFAKRFDRQINWCFCPNANLYIQNKLPKVDLFLDQGFNITLGTDSLASNHKLSVLSEMLTLQQGFPNLEFSRLLTWATLNGARFLGIDNRMGSLEAGKTPGLNLITGMDDLALTPETQVQRLI
jgi:cytosine/adenosine deaminase-related metal-dependent hydrolase